ncbi:MAG: glycosyltransferase, partial [Cyclobacteriaceae bacterium]
MHVLMVSHNYPTEIDSSFGFFCRDQAEALAREGHLVGVVGPLVISVKTILNAKSFHLGYRSEKYNEVNTDLWLGFSLPKLKRLRYWLMNRVGRKMVDKYVKNNCVPDIIHLQVFVAADVALYALSKYNVPLIWSEHFSDVANDNLSNAERVLINKLKRSAKKCIAVSQWLSEKMNQNFGIKAQVVPNVYRDHIFKIMPGISKREKFTFISVAYMQPIKNHARMIEAFSLLSDLPVMLLIIGKGDTLEAYKKIVKDRDLVDRVIFLGELKHDELVLELNKAHAYLVSSDFETFNVSMVEAMACGIPVVSTACGGPESILTKS